MITHATPLTKRYSQVIAGLDLARNNIEDSANPALTEKYIAKEGENPESSHLKLLRSRSLSHLTNNHAAFKKIIPNGGNYKADIIDELFKDPVGVYLKLKNAFEDASYNPSLPELSTTVDYLLSALKHPFIDDLCDCNTFMNQMRETALLKLRHLNFDFEVDGVTQGEVYPHKPTMSGPYPYYPTILAIREGLTFFDAVERSTKQNIPELYHSDRYTYHDQNIVHDKEFMVIPCQKALSLKKLILLRCIPVGLTGVSEKTTFADAYFNTPLDFWVHDMNHNRRFASYNRRYFEKHGITDKKEKIAKFYEFYKIINEKILPELVVKKNMTPEEKNIRKNLTVLFFEYLHEYAFTPDTDSLINAFNFRPGMPAPFEVMTTPEDITSIEGRRMDNFNITSGISYVKNHRNVTIKYFFDKGPNFITSAFNKLNHAFYDNQYQTFRELPAKEYRTPEMLAKAARRMIELFSIHEQVQVTDEELIALAKNEKHDGSVLGPVEKYPDKTLQKPKLKAQVVSDILDSKKIRALCTAKTQAGVK